MFSKLSCLAALSAAAAMAPAFAQVPTLVNGNLETLDPYFASFDLTTPGGWRLSITIPNTASWDMLEGTTPVGGGPPLPATITPRPNDGIAMVRLPGSEGRNAGEFEGVHSENQLNQGDPNSPRNWPEYNFSATNLQPVTISCWFNIPASDPMVKSRFGMKINLLDTNDPGIFFLKEWLDIDPEAVTGIRRRIPRPAAPSWMSRRPRSVEKGIHTNGQWVHFVRTLTTADLVLPTDPNLGAPDQSRSLFDPGGAASILPPTLAATTVSHGSVWVDDITFTQGQLMRYADFNGDGHVTVQDIFSFLAAWFAGTPTADFSTTATSPRSGHLRVPVLVVRGLLNRLVHIFEMNTSGIVPARFLRIEKNTGYGRCPAAIRIISLRRSHRSRHAMSFASTTPSPFRSVGDAVAAYRSSIVIRPSPSTSCGHISAVG